MTQEKLRSIQLALGETRQLLHTQVLRMTERGESVDTLETRASELELTSFQFVVKVVPWYTACGMRWSRRMRIFAPCVYACKHCCCGCSTERQVVRRTKIMDV